MKIDPLSDLGCLYVESRSVKLGVEKVDLRMGVLNNFQLIKAVEPAIEKFRSIKAGARDTESRK